MSRSSLLLLLAACSFGFDSASQVKDLRILGVSVDPPELTSASHVSNVSLRALIVDVDGGTLDYTWSSCIEITSSRCPDGGVQVAQGSAPIGEISASASVPFEVLGLLHSGIRGISPKWELELDTNELVAIKAVTLTPTPVPGQAPNTNPVVTDLTFDDGGWPTAPIPWNVCADADRLKVGMGRNMTLGACTHHIGPVFDAGEAQAYLGTDVSGQPKETVELLSFSWFSDTGKITGGTTRQSDPSVPRFLGRDDLTTMWSEPDGGGSTATFWVVVRDGRGGESWLKRDLTFSP